jgi:hypothetical protein
MANEMPTVCGAWSCEFEPMRNEVNNARLSGDVDAFEVSAPRWGMSFSVDLSSNADLQTYRAWLLKQRGGQVTILGWDRKHPVPRAYLGSAFAGVTVDATTPTVDATTPTVDKAAEAWGNPRITAIDTAGRTISLSGFTPLGVIKAGDPISWYDGRNWVLVKAVEDATATAGGVVSALAVEPRLSAHPDVTGYTLPLPVRMRYACTEMRINPASINVPSDYTKGGVLSFDAYQIVRRS